MVEEMAEALVVKRAAEEMAKRWLKIRLNVYTPLNINISLARPSWLSSYINITSILWMP